MPQNYIKMRTCKYTQEYLHNAVEAVQTKRMTYKQASERFNVPGSVICTRIKCRVTKKESLGAGRSTALSKDVDKAIVQCIQARADMGYPVDKMELLEMVQDYVCQQNIKIPYLKTEDQVRTGITVL